MISQASLLDDLAYLRSGDPQDMLGYVARLPDMTTMAFARGAAWLPPVAKPDRIAVVGMGGSAISGDLARTLLVSRWEVPIAVIRQASLPSWLKTESTLLIFLSYSGETAETCQAFQETLAYDFPVAAVTCGGTLGNLAAARGAPVLQLTPGWQPRAALGELYFTLLGMLSCLGAPVDPGPASFRLARLREDYGPNASGNLAKQLAADLARFFPVILGVAGSTEAVALRWKCQLNENAKRTCLYNIFPELTHNEIVNLVESPEERTFVVLRDPLDSSLINRQIRHTRELLGGLTHDLLASGDDPLERQLSLLYLGDYVSVYLALLRGIDPTPVSPITALKKRMKDVPE
ncbi:MAG: bifunctional phosphoglucose/phosphomannose isomerase [Cyanobacteria bacterium NC_groundwater_1444_Ag_S-0.65um_54_12]|nr:bifunctional phosphoglucose/phosphomannose isomerase [Cyanobacteria bacterium NC_groundwater_1444_Ag_S-0.65um_54_12]